MIEIVPFTRREAEEKAAERAIAAMDRYSLGASGSAVKDMSSWTLTMGADVDPTDRRGPIAVGVVGHCVILVRTTIRMMLSVAAIGAGGSYGALLDVARSTTAEIGRRAESNFGPASDKVVYEYDRQVGANDALILLKHVGFRPAAAKALIARLRADRVAIQEALSGLSVLSKSDIAHVGRVTSEQAIMAWAAVRRVVTLAGDAP